MNMRTDSIDAEHQAMRDKLPGHQFYLIFTEDTDKWDDGDIEERALTGKQHLLWLKQHEQSGLLFGSGPLAPSKEEEQPVRFPGGMFIFRAKTLAEAEAIAESEPFHKAGFRNYTIKPWRMNEGTLTIKVVHSEGEFSFS